MSTYFFIGFFSYFYPQDKFIWVEINLHRFESYSNVILSHSVILKLDVSAWFYHQLVALGSYFGSTSNFFIQMMIIIIAWKRYIVIILHSFIDKISCIVMFGTNILKLICLMLKIELDIFSPDGRFLSMVLYSTMHIVWISSFYCPE